MSWTLRDTALPDPESIDRNGNRYLSGNGRLGLRGTLDELGKDSRTAVIVNGLYDRAGSAWREPVNAPNPCVFRLRCDGVELTLDPACREAQESSGRKLSPPTVERHSHELHFRHGLQYRNTAWKTPGGTRVDLFSRRFVSLTSERLICVEYGFYTDREADITVVTEIDGDVWDLNGPHLTGFASRFEGGVLTLSSKTGEKGIPVSVSEVTSGPVEPRRILRGEKSAGREYCFRAEAGTDYVFRKYIVVRDGLRGSEAEGEAECLSTAGMGFEAVLESHRSLWEERWKRCDIEIEGDEEAQFALRFSMYHLLAIVPASGSGLSIPARGLSGQVYKGGIFWDTEMFMLPFYLASFPALARNLLVYRVNTLDGARRKAKEYGRRGAFYAWESQETGDDACTLFNVTDVFTGRPMRTFFRDRQIHISADMVEAFRSYFESTGDGSLYLDGGAEAVYECARFLVSWLYYKPDRDRYEVLDVTGPDEYHERVHNDYFTNFMTARALRSCLEMDRMLRTEHPEEHREITVRLNLESELAEWRTILDRLYVPSPDPETGVIEQFDGYQSLEEVTVPDLLSRKLHPNEYLGGGNGLARWTRVIKQADVVLVTALFPGRFPDRVLRANWDFYEPRTEHGSSLSASAYSIAAARLGYPDKAYDYFMKTATIDITGSSKQFVGDLYIGGTHPAANGGAWLAAVRGFCGTRVSRSALTVEPSLPASWRSVTLSLSPSGIPIRLTVTNDRCELRADGPLPEGFTVTYSGKTVSWNGTVPLRLTREDHACSPR